MLVDWKGQKPTRGRQVHIDAHESIRRLRGRHSAADRLSDPIKFGSGEWTRVIGEFENGERMVTVAKWRDGAIAEEYIWS